MAHDVTTIQYGAARNLSDRRGYVPMVWVDGRAILSCIGDGFDTTEEAREEAEVKAKQEARRMAKRHGDDQQVTISPRPIGLIPSKTGPKWDFVMAV